MWKVWVMVVVLLQGCVLCPAAVPGVVASEVVRIPEPDVMLLTALGLLLLVMRRQRVPAV